MAWVKLDDRFFDNPKIAALSDGAQLAYLKSLTYCASQLTDGKFPLRKAREFATPKAIKELVAGLWDEDAGGFVVHDYLTYNPTREQVLKERQERHEQKSRAGIKGMAKRWHSDNTTNNTPITEDVTEPKHSDNPVPVPVPVPPFLPPPGDDVGKLLVDFGKVGLMSPGLVQSIEEDIVEFGIDWVKRVVAKALASGKTDLPWNWCRSTLEGWKARGGPDESRPRLQAVGRSAGRSKNGAGDDFGVAEWESYAAGEDQRPAATSPT